MAASPKWKVYDSNGVYQAACKEIEGAASVVSFYGDGATIKLGHGDVVWHEGAGFDGIACENYDFCAVTVYARLGVNVLDQAQDI